MTAETQPIFPAPKCAYCQTPIRSAATFSSRYKVVCCNAECLCLYIETREQADTYIQQAQAGSTTEGGDVQGK